MRHWTLKLLLLVRLLLPSISFIASCLVCIADDVRPSVETRLSPISLIGNLYQDDGERVDGKRSGPSWLHLLRSHEASVGSLREKNLKARDLVSDESSYRPAQGCRVGRGRYNTTPKITLFKSFYYVVRLDYTYVLCIVFKTDDVAASAGFSIGRQEKRDESHLKMKNERPIISVAGAYEI